MPQLTSASPLVSLLERSYYSAHFMDISLWEPYVHQACRQQGYSCAGLRPAHPGTFPTFIAQGAAQSVVVKFFGLPFNGAAAFLLERELGSRLPQYGLPIPSPAVLGQGTLEPGWSYLFIEYIPGVSIGELRGALPSGEWATVARCMGDYTRQLHAIPIPELHALPVEQPPSWEPYFSFLQKQTHSCFSSHSRWHDLSPHQLAQINEYLLPPGALVDLSSPPHLVHADLTEDHLLGEQVDGAWHTRALIDWGDARLGSPLYELVALHLDLFRGDTGLLREYLRAYALPPFYQQEFAHKALSTALLHQFPLPHWVGELSLGCPSLQQLAERIYLPG